MKSEGNLGIVLFLSILGVAFTEKQCNLILQPDRTQKVLNGSCLVFNWDNMTCVWDLETVYMYANTAELKAPYTTELDFTHLDYDVSLHWSVLMHLSPCKNLQIGRKCLTCVFKKDDDNDSYKGGMYKFVLNVTNSRRPETSVSSPFLFDTDELVQPASVDDIKTKVNKTYMLISWSHSKARSLRFKIQYKPEWENYWKEEIINREIDDLTALTRPSKEISIELTNLTTYTTYKIRISCIPIVQKKVRGFWSEVTPTTARTLEDVPSAVPEVHPSFFSCLNVLCSEVNIYWKPINHQDKRCAVMRYKIELMSPNCTHSEPIYATDEAVSAKLSLTTNITNNITIIPFNDKTKEFPELIPSQLVIPPESQRPPSPLHFEVLSDHLKSRHLTLTWSYPYINNISINRAFTVAWCKKGKERECQGEFNWMTSVLNTSLRLEISEGATADDYMYGIAANGYYRGVNSSSGIVWVDCVHFTNITTSEKLNVKLVLDKFDQSSMNILWIPYNCKQFRGHVIHYAIKYCEFRSCEETSKFVNVSRHVRNYTLRGLSPTKYSVWVSAVSDAGPGPSSELEFAIFHHRKYSLNDDNGILANGLAVIFGILGFILVVFLVYLFRKRCKIRGQTEIILPDIVKARKLHATDFVEDKSYDSTEIHCDTTGEKIPGFSEKSQLFSGEDDKPISEERAYVLDNSSKNKSIQYSLNCEILQPLLTVVEDKILETEDSSVDDDLHYSLDDINIVLDNNCVNEDENLTDTGNSRYHESVSEYVPPYSYRSRPFIEVEGYVDNGNIFGEING